MIWLQFFASYCSLMRLCIISNVLFVFLCYRYGNLLPQERERIGYWCKNLIDHGRVCYLRSKGYNADIVAYVDKAYTVENTALMATKPQSL